MTEGDGNRSRLSRVGRIMHCKNCHQEGHNILTCKEPKISTGNGTNGRKLIVKRGGMNARRGGVNIRSGMNARTSGVRTEPNDENVRTEGVRTEANIGNEMTAGSFNLNARSRGRGDVQMLECTQSGKEFLGTPLMENQCLG